MANLTKAQKQQNVVNAIENIWKNYMPSGYSLAIICGTKKVLLVNKAQDDNTPCDCVVDLYLGRPKCNMGAGYKTCGYIQENYREENYTFRGKVYTTVGANMVINYDLSGDELIETVAHELRHVWQKRNGWQIVVSNDYDNYYNSAHEVDAREFAEMVVAKENGTWVEHEVSEPVTVKQWHKQLVRNGYYKVARSLLHAMANGDTLFVSDGNHEAHESGLAAWLQNNRKWRNVRCGFRAYL